MLTMLILCDISSQQYIHVKTHACNKKLFQNTLHNTFKNKNCCWWRAAKFKPWQLSTFSLWAESAVYKPKTAVAVLEVPSQALPHLSLLQPTYLWFSNCFLTSSCYHLLIWGDLQSIHLLRLVKDDNKRKISLHVHVYKWLSDNNIS